MASHHSVIINASWIIFQAVHLSFPHPRVRFCDDRSFNKILDTAVGRVEGREREKRVKVVGVEREKEEGTG